MSEPLLTVFRLDSGEFEAVLHECKWQREEAGRIVLAAVRALAEALAANPDHELLEAAKLIGAIDNK